MELKLQFCYITFNRRTKSVNYTSHDQIRTGLMLASRQLRANSHTPVAIIDNTGETVIYPQELTNLEWLQRRINAIEAEMWNK